MKVILKCHEANHVCDKKQYKEASFIEKVKLTIHLAYCRACRSYSANNNTLTKIMNSPKVSTLSHDKKNALKERIKRELSQ